jgi:hypothetical protein
LQCLLNDLPKFTILPTSFACSWIMPEWPLTYTLVAGSNPFDSTINGRMRLSAIRGAGASSGAGASGATSDTVEAVVDCVQGDGGGNRSGLLVAAMVGAGDSGDSGNVSR